MMTWRDFCVRSFVHMWASRYYMDIARVRDLLPYISIRSALFEYVDDAMEKYLSLPEEVMKKKIKNAVYEFVEEIGNASKI